MKKRTEAQWRALIQQQQVSGLTAEKFCRRHGLNATYFSLRKHQLGLTKPKPDSSPFVSLSCTELSTVAAALTLQFIGGTLQFSVLPSPEWLAKFIRVAP